MTIDPADIERLKLGADLAALFLQDGTEVVREGSRMKCCCPFHADGSPSLYIYEDNTWHCFGCRAHGDVIEYLMKRRGLDFAGAMAALGAPTTPTRPEPAKRHAARKYEPIMPVPPNAPACRYHAGGKLGAPTHVWPYLDAAGRLLQVVARYAETKPDGRIGKTVRTWCWALDTTQATRGWTMTRPAKGLPLYGLDRLAAKPAAVVLLVEGEKCADVADQPGFVGITWCGGAANVDKQDKVDWSPLTGRRVLLWPDLDKPGALAMSRIADHLTAAGVASIDVVDLRHLIGVPDHDGWDIADATDDDIAGILATSLPVTDALPAYIAQFPGDVTAPKPLAASDGGAEGPGDPPVADAPPSAPNPDDDLESNDIAAASRFVSDHLARVLYCPTWERWHVWDGRRWRADDDGTVMRLAEQTALAIAADLRTEAEQALITATAHRETIAATNSNRDATPDERREANRLEGVIDGLRRVAKQAKAKADQVQSLKRLKDMVELAKTRADIIVAADQLDAEALLLNCRNGVVDLRTGAVYKHDPKRRITRLAPVDFDPAAPLGRLADVLDHLFQGDADLARFAQDVLGNSLQGNNRLEQFYVWYGPGGSGKGTLMESLKSAIGDYAMTAEFQSFVKTQGHRVRDDLARLNEARVVLGSEIEAGEQMASGVIKSITGRDTITARQLYGTYFEFRPRLTLHLQCNDLPRADDQDSGLWRRLVVIPCGPELAPDKKDPGLKDYLLDPERGGKAMLSWLIAGAIRTHSQKRLVEPDQVKAATAAYRRDQDPTKEFFAEALRFAHVDNAKRTTCAVADLLKSYGKWCDDNLLAPRLRCSPRTIAHRLEGRGCWRGKARFGEITASCWLGVTLPTSDHVASGKTFTPDDAEHESALSSVPVFRCSATRESPTRACARPPSCDDSLKIEEQKNTGTNQNTPADQPTTPDLGDI